MKSHHITNSNFLLIISVLFCNTLIAFPQFKASDSISYYHKRSENYFSQKNYTKACLYKEKEVQYYEKKQLLNSDYCRTLDALGFFYLKTSQAEKALFYWKKTKKKNKNPLYTAIAYARIASYYYRNNAFNESISYFKKAIPLLKTLKAYQTLAAVYINYARTLDEFDSQEYKQLRLRVMQKCLKLKDKTVLKKQTLNLIYYHLGSYYQKQQPMNFESAKKNYLIALDYSYKQHDSIYIGSRLLQLGKLYVKAKKDSAYYYLEQAKKYKLGLILIKYYHYQLSEAYLNKGNYPKGLQEINIALSQFTQTPLDSVQHNTIRIKSNEEKYRIRDLLRIKSELQLALYHKTDSLHYCKEALQTLLFSDTYFDDLKKAHQTKVSQLYWSDKAIPFYEKIIYCASILQDNALVFRFMEKSKALLLRENLLAMLQNKSKQDSLNSVQEAANAHTDTLRTTINKAFFNRKAIALQHVQNTLDTNQVVMNYFWNSPNKLYILAISKNKSSLHTINDSTLVQKTQAYVQAINAPIQTKKALNNYSTNAFLLYQALFPKAIQNSIQNKKVLIIPYGNLQNIPFEALITQANSTHYLLQDCALSYAYSMSFLQANNKLQRKGKNAVLAVAPIHFSNDSLTPLLTSEKEVAGIQQYFTSTTLVGSAASKANFEAAMSAYSILHLATHADAHSKGKPWIAFYDTTMSLNELYSKHIQSDLVTLSACNTNTGKLANGEGVLSLARGFFHAGANTVVSSLWQVDDAATTTLMTDFYKYLAAGKSKSDALSQAKRDYIAQHTLSDASPYYWASFILLGDTGTLQTESTVYLYYWIIGIAVLLLGLIIRIRTIKKLVI